MRYTVKVLFIILIFVIQSTWIQYIRILGVSPNLLIAGVVALVFISTTVESAFYGIFAGILQDLMWGRVFGLHTLLLFYTALLLSALIKYMYKRSLLITVVITFLSTIIYELIVFFLSFVIWKESGFLYAFFRIIIPSAAYTAILQIILIGFLNLLPVKVIERGGRA